MDINCLILDEKEYDILNILKIYLP